MDGTHFHMRDYTSRITLVSFYGMYLFSPPEGNSPGPKIRKNGGEMGCSGPLNTEMDKSDGPKLKNKMASK